MGIYQRIKNRISRQQSEDDQGSAWARGESSTAGIPSDLYVHLQDAHSSIVETCLAWISDTLILSPVKLYMPSGVEVTTGIVPLLLQRPSGSQIWTDLVQQTVGKMILDGAAEYVIIDDELVIPDTIYRNSRLGPYTASLGNTTYTLPQEAVVKVPYRVDRKGKSYTPLNSTRIEQLTDHIRAWRTGTLLEYESAPNMLFSPKSTGGRGSYLNKTQMDGIVDQMQKQARSGRGKVEGVSVPIDVYHSRGTNLQSLDMRSIAWIAEERVTSVLRVSADVVKLGVGLEQTRVGATMHEAVLDSWRGAVRPIQRRIEDALTQLFTVWYNLPQGTVVRFDNAGLAVLAEEDERVKQLKSTRLLAELDKNVIDIREYREMIGYE